jgi:hypothetical protein
MKFLIVTDTDGGEAWLTNENCCSRYGFPVLVITAKDIDGIFGPGDLIGELPNLVFAAQIVAGWATDSRRTEQERNFAERFCSQFVPGPAFAVLASIANQGNNISDSHD